MHSLHWACGDQLPAAVSNYIASDTTFLVNCLAAFVLMPFLSLSGECFETEALLKLLLWN